MCCASPARCLANNPRFSGSDATLVLRRVFSAQIFHFGARIRSSSAGQDALRGHATPHPMISLDRLACCAYGATPRAHRRRPTPATEVQRCSVRIIIILWTGRPCRRRQCWLWLKRKHATGPASASKLRQNRSAVNGHSLRFKCIATALRRSSRRTSCNRRSGSSSLPSFSRFPRHGNAAGECRMPPKPPRRIGWRRVSGPAKMKIARQKT